ncbi:MAG: sigma-70 family RNA polymerase sigma factor [Planctomycetota bacterium]
MSPGHPTNTEHHYRDGEPRLSRHADTRTDEEIVATVVDGDVNEFEVIVRRYDAEMMRIAVARLGSRELAEDAVHEAFIAAFRGLTTFDLERSFRSWLVTILIHKCHRGYRRKVTTEGRVVPLVDEPVSSAPNASKSMEQRESYDLLYERLAQLEPNQADAIWMRYFGKLKFREIAEAAGVSLATAKNRVRAGLERLSRMLNDERDR